MGVLQIVLGLRTLEFEIAEFFGKVFGVYEGFEFYWFFESVFVEVNFIMFARLVDWLNYLLLFNLIINYLRFCSFTSTCFSFL